MQQICKNPVVQLLIIIINQVQKQEFSIFDAMQKTLSALIILICFTSCGKYISETGKASYYADKYDGRPTASGEIFRQNKLTAAHPSLAFGTKVKVKNLSNGKTVTVTINDRGPFVANRIIDLSKKAAGNIDMIKQGVATVKITYRRKKR